MEIKTIKKTQMEATLGMDKPRKENRNFRWSTISRIQEMQGRISGTEDTIEEIDILVKENAKCKKFLTKNSVMKRPNLRVIGIEDGKDSKFKVPKSIFNKIIEEIFSNVNKQIAINAQEA